MFLKKKKLIGRFYKVSSLISISSRTFARSIFLLGQAWYENRSVSFNIISFWNRIVAEPIIRTIRRKSHRLPLPRTAITSPTFLVYLRASKPKHSLNPLRSPTCRRFSSVEFIGRIHVFNIDPRCNLSNVRTIRTEMYIGIASFWKQQMFQSSLLEIVRVQRRIYKIYDTYITRYSQQDRFHIYSVCECFQICHL